MNREILIDWVRQRRQLSLERDGSDRPWRFVPLKTKGSIVFHTASDKLEQAHTLGLSGIRETSRDRDGMSTYTIDLSGPR